MIMEIALWFNALAFVLNLVMATHRPNLFNCTLLIVSAIFLAQATK